MDHIDSNNKLKSLEERKGLEGSGVKAGFGAEPAWRKGQESHFSSPWIQQSMEARYRVPRRSARVGGMSGPIGPNTELVRHRILRTFHARLVEFKFSQEARVSH